MMVAGKRRENLSKVLFVSFIGGSHDPSEERAGIRWNIFRKWKGHWTVFNRFRMLRRH